MNIRSKFQQGCFLLLATVSSVFAVGSDSAVANKMVEFAFTADHDHDNPFNDVTLDAIFNTPSGAELRVPAFWAGGNQWKIRYMSSEVGIHRFHTECSDAQDAGLHGITGQLEVSAYSGTNSLYLHGPLQVSKNHRHLEHADGKPFFWLGDTWWMGLSKRLKWPEEVKTLAQDRKNKGFNVIQIVMGPPPDSFPFDPRSMNEAGFPWEDEYASIRPEYYDAADQRIMYLVEQGFTPCMFGMWGYHMRFMGVKRAKQHWRYLIARYSALPVVWCVAGEANLPWYLAEGFPYDDREQVARWTEVMRYIRSTDPYHRLLTAHPTGFGWSARSCVDDVTLLDFDMLQTPHGQRDAVDLTVGTVRKSYAATPTMPVIDGEAAYEMLLDSLPTQWTRQMFWLCMTNGAAGHSYGANGIWQLNRPDDPHGPSPQMEPGVGYGAIPWNEAMNLPGSTQVAFGKKLFEKYSWYEFQPHPEWVRYANEEQSHPPKSGQWLWHDEGDPSVNAPAEARYFRKTFELPAGEKPTEGTLWISADDQCKVYVNGKDVGSHTGHASYKKIDVTTALQSGHNVLAIEARNLPTAGTANPAGLLASLCVQTDIGDGLTILSDSSWRTARTVVGEGWQTLAMDDKDWSAAKELGGYGAIPWGTFLASTSYGPYATGAAGQVRIIYVPERRSITVLNLNAKLSYRGYWFEVTTGKITDLGEVVTGDLGEWAAPDPPTDSNVGDWVLVVEANEAEYAAEESER